MQLIMALIVGFVVGVLAKLLKPGRDPGGFVVTTLLGIAGAVVATFGGRALGLYGPGEPAGFIASVVGALVLLFIYSAATKRRVA